MEVVPAPANGRVFSYAPQPGLADVAPSGRVRLDALARWLQDAAWADVVDSGVPDEGVWVVRRMAMRVARFPRFGQAVAVDTFCSGTGRLWAERRSTVRGEGGPLVEAVGLWVHLDGSGTRPRPLPDGFDAVYGPAAGGRRVMARLRHPPAPPAGADVRPWRFRAADLDLAGHVNNAVYWQVLEEELSGLDSERALECEMEHRAPGDAGEALVHRAGGLRWIASSDGAVLATLEASWP